MTKNKKTSNRLMILRDGVFPHDDVMMNKGDEAVNVDPAIAAKLIANGHAKPI